jgi:hypothetical protein
MGIAEVQFTVYSGEAYDAAIKQVRTSPGWLEMSIVDTEAFCVDDPLAEMTAYFDTEQHAMLFRLRMGV